ncbi:TetR/AcrR family transcriptional regulator [Acidovorax sp. SUPP1855]|uniref:TetR/AcrR family transcriptional regulator n=1 Tax=Acidovorax sp. SUPP1855 TaxID=431774 RepID=UPI0023DE4CD6|nr:TetR/AcrR family transcriptional regulator [Acidovorax sp. SUPP1855]GKS84391.1 TetR/AcrR family transcriptional regulator [Acidovorax sp. SUPP1855]
MTIELDDKLAGALALAVSQHPRANLQQLARAAGTSKGTLYRICTTREGVIEILMERAKRHMREALDKAHLMQPPFVDALHRLTEHLMTRREFYLFWNAAMWVNLGDAKDHDVKGYVASFFSDALEDFFLRGQKAGIFRIDMPARWLAKSYDFLLYAAIESALRGEIASLGMPMMVDKMFLHGASADAAPETPRATA